LARHRDPLKPEDLWNFAAADVAARPAKGNRAPTFSIRSPRMITGSTPYVRQVTTIETIF
jgi:hypothetical protein